MHLNRLCSFRLYAVQCTEVGTIWGRPESTWDAQVLVTLLSPPILETKWTWSTTIALKCKVRNAKTKKMQRRTRCPNPRDSGGGSYFGELPPGADSHGPSTLAGTNLNRENCTVFLKETPVKLLIAQPAPPLLEKSVNIVWHDGTQPIQRSIWKNTILASNVYKLTTLFTAKGNFG